METANRRNDGALARTSEPRVDDLGTNAELLSLAADSLALAEQVDCLTQKNTLIRAARALLHAARGEVDDVGSWRTLGEVAASVARRGGVGT